MMDVSGQSGRVDGVPPKRSSNVLAAGQRSLSTVDGHRVRLTIFYAAMLVALTLIIIGLWLAVAGPTSNLYPIGPLWRLSSVHPGGKVFVRNPELSDELEILQASGVFEIVPADKASRALELRPREMGGACGNPLLLTWATYGLVPATVPFRSTFSFTLEQDDIVSEQQYVLEAESRVSLVQQLYRPFRSEARTLGAILASEYERGR